MAQNLIETAKKEGMTKSYISALIRNKGGNILLVEEILSEKRIYGFPTYEIKRRETLSQALERLILEKTGMDLEQVIKYLGHYDLDRARYFHFLVEVKDPYSIEKETQIGYSWVELEEAFGYPITDETRKILDLYAKEN